MSQFATSLISIKQIQYPNAKITTRNLCFLQIVYSLMFLPSILIERCKEYLEILK